MTESTLTCPSCDGRKTTTAFVEYVDGGSVQTMNCLTCRGVGSISPEHQARIEEGKKRRKERLARGVGLTTEAKRLGISATQLSRIERGAE